MCNKYVILFFYVIAHVDDTIINNKLRNGITIAGTETGNKFVPRNTLYSTQWLQLTTS